MLPEENISQNNIVSEKDNKSKEQQKSSSQLSQVEPEDILAEIEEKIPDVSAKSSSDEGASQIKIAPIKMKAKFNFKILIIPLIIIILLGAIYGGYLLASNYWQKFTEKKELTSEVEIPAETPEREILGPISNDADGDGLTNEEETALGIDPNNPDTDNDGLFDREEVKIYQTNPLNPDTDGDGIPDGVEVKRGDDPNDPTPGARLLKLEEEINNLK